MGKLLGVIVLALCLIAGLSFLMALPTKILWNWLLPAIFGLPKITFWQAWGINLLASILFKSSSHTQK